MREKPADFLSEPCVPGSSRPVEARSKWFRGLRRLAASSWNSVRRIAASPARMELQVLNLGKRAQPNGLYSPADVIQAAVNYRANCGPASFAALTRRPVSDVMVFFDHFPDKPWTTKNHMRGAMASAKLKWQECERELPKVGLALIQLIGPWCKPGIHPGASLARTHWIAVSEGAFYDVNWEGWLPQDVWEQLVFVSLQQRYTGCYGWDVLVGFEVDAGENSELSFPRHSSSRRKVEDLQRA